MTGKVIVVAGPTASGKSALAVDIAKYFGGIIINCDSMQVYKDMPVITACPGEKEKRQVEHRLFEIYDCSFRGNVVDWLERAVAEIADIWAADRLPVVVGGTGLYIDNLINGTTPVPETGPDIREEVAVFVRENGMAALYEKLRAMDAESAARLNPRDISRIMRAVEVGLDTGRPLSWWHKQPLVKKLQAVFTVIKICPRTEELDARCYERFDLMLRNGALEEAQRLERRGLDESLPAMKALGVPELIAYIRGRCPLEEAVAAAKLHTRQYAKRQRTWFKNKLKADIELSACYNGDFAPIAVALEKAGFYSGKE